MIPKAKLNLHQCDYHLSIMRNAQTCEEFEIGYAAFVMSARTVTFVLQKEFSEKPKFMTWYQKKREEMDKDSLAKFFLKQRNSIEKEGINSLEFFAKIKELNLPGDVLSKVADSEIQMSAKGVYHLVNKGTAKEDLLPAKTKGQMIIAISVRFDGQAMDVLKVCETHYLNLKNIVEEWTGIINQSLPEGD